MAIRFKRPTTPLAATASASPVNYPLHQPHAARLTGFHRVLPRTARSSSSGITLACAARGRQLAKRDPTPTPADLFFFLKRTTETH